LKWKLQLTLELSSYRSVSGSLSWRDIDGLCQKLVWDIREKAGNRVAVVLLGEARVFHKHPILRPDTDNGDFASIIKGFGVTKSENASHKSHKWTAAIIKRYQ
jgi:hypothetical protein